MKSLRGFTLVELIIVIVITALLASVAVIFMREGLESYNNGKPIIPIAGKTNIAVDNLLRELEGAESISAFASNTLTFVNQQGQSIIIALSGTNLMRTVNGSSAQILCNNISALSFAGYDSIFSATAIAMTIRFVTVSITVTETANNTTIPYSLIAATTLRRLL